jgi:peptidyl-prolyl cis-trans isomerase C
LIKVSRMVFPALLLALSACEGGGGAPSENVIARAAGEEFLVEDAAQILAPQSQLPNQTAVVKALADLWVDYFLLAHAASQDTSFAQLDVTSLVEQQVGQEMVFRLREQVIQVDTSVTEEELRAQFAADLPGAQVRARHILLRIPDGATDQQADSVRALGESLRERILDGEDFAALAIEHSDDPGSGQQGGDLGAFGKGQMVKPFEDAAFALEPGELSELVETNFGLHLIRVDERIMPSFEENRDQFRAVVQNRRVAVAESTYVAEVMEAAGLEVRAETFESARKLAETPSMALSRRAGNRALVTYDGGSYTLSEFQTWIQAQAPNLHAEVQGANDEQLDGLLRNLVRTELLLNSAVEAGVEVPPDRRDSLSAAIRSGVRSVAGQLNFLGLGAGEDATPTGDLNQAVHGILVDVVQNRREVFPLGGVSAALRKQYGGDVFPAAFDLAVERIQTLRSQMPGVPTADSTPPSPAPDSAPPDTVGSGG